LCFGLLPLSLELASSVADEALADDVLTGATEFVGSDVEELLPVPASPPVAPVAAILASASASVSQVMLVPAELTSGSAKHCSPEEQEDRANFPPEHCANCPSTQAELPSVHDVEVVSVANCALSFWASNPF